MLKPPAPFRVAALKNVATLVKGAPGLVYGFSVQNLDAAIEFLQFYDKATAAAVTVGTTVPLATFALASSGQKDIWLPVGDDESAMLQFSLGIVIAFTAAFDGSGSAPASGLNIGALGYA